MVGNGEKCLMLKQQWLLLCSFSLILFAEISEGVLLLSLGSFRVVNGDLWMQFKKRIATVQNFLHL